MNQTFVKNMNCEKKGGGYILAAIYPVKLIFCLFCQV